MKDKLRARKENTENSQKRLSIIKLGAEAFEMTADSEFGKLLIKFGGNKMTHSSFKKHLLQFSEDNKLYATGSRTLAALGIADNILAAEQIAEEIIQQISGSVFHRKDIGTAELINKKITQINQLCGTNYKSL